MFEWLDLGGNNRKGGQSLVDTCSLMCTDNKYWLWQLSLALVICASTSTRLALLKHSFHLLTFYVTIKQESEC